MGSFELLSNSCIIWLTKIPQIKPWCQIKHYKFWPLRNPIYNGVWVKNQSRKSSKWGFPIQSGPPPSAPFWVTFQVPFGTILSALWVPFQVPCWVPFQSLSKKRPRKSARIKFVAFIFNLGPIQDPDVQDQPQPPTHSAPKHLWSC